jgi:thiamine kinase-like enzyme
MSHIYWELKEIPIPKEAYINTSDGRVFLMNADGTGKKKRKVIRSFAEAIPEDTHCVHGDFQPGNLIQADGSHYWIDLDRFAYGDPMFDIGHLYLVCQVYSSMKRVQDIFHMTIDQFHAFWDAFAKAYTGKEDHEEFDRQAGRFACIDVIVRIRFVPPSFIEKLFFGFYVRKLYKRYF